MNKGVLCISWDTELLWGRRDLNWQKFVSRVRKEREIIKNILTILKKYEIPTTWAVVGKMWQKGDPDWYGPDIVKMIKNTAGQEIGSHSYSHELFDQIDTQTAKIEAQNPFKLKSFVFPKNKVGYLKILKKNGFTTFRGPDKSEYELLLPRVPLVYKPFIDNGLVNIPGSMYLVSGRGLRKFIPQGLRWLKVKMGIDGAILEQKVFHIWAHPIDLVNDTEKIMANLERICEYASQKRGNKILKIQTMGEIASESDL